MKRGRPVEQPIEVKEKFTRVVKHDDGSVTTWYYDYSKTKLGPIKTETKYPKGLVMCATALAMTFCPTGLKSITKGYIYMMLKLCLQKVYV